jgi:hypothetical protein
MTAAMKGPFGLFNRDTIIKAMRNSKLLAYMHQRHSELGRTYLDENWHKTLVITNDPENIKCVLSTRSEGLFVSFQPHISKTLF